MGCARAEGGQGEAGPTRAGSACMRQRSKAGARHARRDGRGLWRDNGKTLRAQELERKADQLQHL